MQEILRPLALAACYLIAVLLLSLAAHAQQAPAKSPFGVPVAPAPATENVGDAATAPPAGLIDRGWAWLLETQSRLNRDMAAAVRRLKSENPLAAAFALIAIAFGYGVLHAAGPGHGKAVISSYVLANEQTVRRGIALSFLAALFQALSAILFVGILAIALKQTSIEMRATESTIETISWGLVALIGAYLLWRQIVGLWGSRASSSNARTHIPHDEHHHHAHGENCACGHSHMPAPKDLQGPWSWKKALPIALSVGIRPCTGALLLLVFALSQGMFWAGILGTFAMALGTAITVSVLAAMAVGSRNFAERASGPASVWAHRIHAIAGVAGAALVFGLGSAFFFASMRGSGPL